MKKSYLVIRLKASIEKFRQWMNQRKRNDDDWFDHPFVIY
jgi:hypothetical protein